MKIVLMPFIFVYRIVHTIISVPLGLFHKTEDAVLETKDKNNLKREENQTEQLVANSVNYTHNEVTAGNYASLPSNNRKTKRARSPLFEYKYTTVNAVGKKEMGAIQAESVEDARNFLGQLHYDILDIEPRSKMDFDISIGSKIKIADLSFSLTQLSTYLKAGIPLVDSVKILAKQTSKRNLKKSYNQIVYELLRGENFSDALSYQGNTFPKLLINMVKTAEMTGDLASILDDMAEYYTSMDNTRKQMRSAMTYPAVVLVLALGVLGFMLTSVVPQFSSMFAANGASLPVLTQAIVNISNFVKNYFIFIIIAIILIIGGLILLYKKELIFRTTVQTIAMHLPVFGNIIIYNEVANFTKTFASLLNHGVFITDSMEILSQVTSNEVYKRIISKTLVNLGKGDTISSAFRGEWAIPVVAYEMIITGESTGQLGSMMEKVADHFQILHKNIVDQMKSLVEPLLIVALAIIVGVILISIVEPMFGIYSTLS